jgi:hypothetical protein
LAWTPDGHWIVAQDRETGELLMVYTLFSVSTGEKKLMIQSPMGYFDENPAFLSLRRCYSLCPVE